MTNDFATQKVTIAEFMHKDTVLRRFTELLGDREGKSYVQSVLIAASSSNDLMQCTPQSIMRSALRAASLGLSCDPALKQAWLVPYNKNVGTRDNPKWVKEAQFQPHYKGLYTLAMRTGKYWQINVSPVYEGQRVLENPLTGLHAVTDGSLIAQPDSYNPAYVDVTVRRRKDMKVIGWIGYFKTKKGFEKSVWMSATEIDDHARKYVKDYDKNPNWNDPEKRPVMEMKTVLRQLLSWADMSGTENSQLAEALQADDGAIEGETSEVLQIPADIKIADARQVPIKFGKKEQFIGELPVEALNAIITSDKATPEQREAATVVLRTDFSMEPVEAPHTKEQNLKELGFE